MATGAATGAEEAEDAAFSVLVDGFVSEDFTAAGAAAAPPLAAAGLPASLDPTFALPILLAVALPILLAFAAEAGREPFPTVGRVEARCSMLGAAAVAGAGSLLPLLVVLAAALFFAADAAAGATPVDG